MSQLSSPHVIIGSIVSSVSCVIFNKKILAVVPAPISLSCCHFFLTTLVAWLTGTWAVRNLWKESGSSASDKARGRGAAQKGTSKKAGSEEKRGRSPGSPDGGTTTSSSGGRSTSGPRKKTPRKNSPASPTADHRPYGIRDHALLGVLGATSISAMNMSLGENSVAFYQLTKVALVPTMVVFNFLVHGTRTGLEVLSSLTV